MSKCSGRKRDGSSCSVTVEPPQSLCWWHSPTNAQARQRAASRGGRGKANSAVKDLQIQLSSIIDQVLDGELVPYRGSVAAQLIGAKIRLIEIERKAQEQQESEERLRRIEALERGRGRGWGA